MNLNAGFVVRSGLTIFAVLATLATVVPSARAQRSPEFKQSVQPQTVLERITGPPKLSKQLQRTLERSRARTVTPGAQAAVVRDGELVWFGNDGRAVRRPFRRVSKNTLFYFASFGKMILASFTLHQVEAGVLELDEPIRAYVGKSVPASGRITLRMLLGHTAGYPDIYSHPKIAPLLGRKYDPNRKWSFRTLFKGLRRPRNPGREWEYSNTGYLIVGYVLSKVVDRSLPLACLEFLAPTGLAEPAVTMRRSKEAAKHIAHGYEFYGDPPHDTFKGAKSIPTDLFGIPWGDGAFSGTGLGAAMFLDGLLVNDRLLDPQTVEQMILPTSQSIEQGADYGLGTERFVASDRTWQGHSGAYRGFSSMGYTDLESGVTIVVVANGYGLGGGLPADSIWRDIARVYVREELSG
jgi:D-alanyl-D-alanine carboxypeptidase